MRFLFSTFNAWPGVVTCLDNIKSIIKSRYPDAQIISKNFDSGHLSFSLIKEVKMNAPDYLFLGGWDNRIKTIAQNTSKRTKTVLMWCSPITQIDLGGEITRFFDVWNCLEGGFIDHLAIPLESDYLALNKLNKNVTFFPIYMDTNELEKNRLNAAKESAMTKCDLFCAPCARKNILSQIFALSLHRDSTKLYVNYLKSPQNDVYLDAAKRLIPNFQNTLWMNRKEYLEKIQTMDFGLQVSLSESFDYVAAEHMYYKKPVVLSSIIPYANYNHELSPVVINDHQDVHRMSEVMGKLIKEKDFREDMGNISYETITKYNERSKDILQESIVGVVE